jgi:hypothetical protein
LEGHKMELVYTSYLDIPMMEGFLASLEGGILEEAGVEGKAEETDERTRRASLKAGVSGLLSGIIGASGEFETAKKVAESLGSQYKGTVRFPSSSLFIRLRKLLLDAGVLTIIEDSSQFNRIRIGGIVEVPGLALPNPASQIRDAFSQLVPIIENYQRFASSQIDQKLRTLDAARVNQTIKIGGEDIRFNNQPEINAARKLAEASRVEIQNQSAIMDVMGGILAGLVPQDSIDTLLLKGEDFHSVSRVYPAFARNERVREMYGANWRALGKVIGLIPESQEFDLLQGLPIGYFAKNLFPQLANAFTNESLNVPINEPVVQGPVVILATMAVFA